MGRLALVTLLCVLPAVAFADDDIEMDGDAPPNEHEQHKDPKLARKWLQTGKTLVAKAEAAARAKKPDEAKVQFENAITAYEKAIESSDDVNLYYELAVVEEKASKLDRAATHFRAFVKLEGARADLVKKAQARFDDLTMKTGLVTIITKPDDATIKLGDLELGKTPLPEPLVLMPGMYTVTLSAEGHATKELEFEVEAGSESERTVELDPVKAAPEDEPEVEPEKPIEQPVPMTAAGPSKLPLYVGAGAAGGFVLIATITGIAAVGKHSTFEDDTASPIDRENAKDAGKTLALVTDLCLIGAVAAGGFTAYWYLAKYKPAQRKMAVEATAKATVVPWVQPDAGGLVLAGSF